MESQNDFDALNVIFKSQKEYSYTVKMSDAKTRRKKLRNLLALVESKKELIRQALFDDFRKPSVEVDLTEIYPITTEIKHAIKHLPNWMKPKRAPFAIAYANVKSYVVPESKGTSLVISPWNFPFQLALGPVVSAISAGNTVILKPSEFTPSTSALLKSILESCFDEREVCVAEGDHKIASHLTSLPFDHIFFTGSPQIGKKVMESASKNLSTVTLELGGKSPCIVDETANLAEAASKIAWGKFMNNGQTCVAPDYILIHESKEHQFLKLISEKITSFYGKEQTISKTKDYARIINSRHFERLRSMYQESIGMGANLIFGGEFIQDQNYISPTVLSGVSAEMPVMKEEIFGPILPVISYRNSVEAIEIVRSQQKPLALYIFSRDKRNRKLIMQSTHAGGSCINDCVVQFNHPSLPFGGSNNSGFGNSHGYYGFKAFSHERSVIENNVRFSPIQLMFPPYNKTVKKIVELTLKWL